MVAEYFVRFRRKFEKIFWNIRRKYTGM